MRWWPRRRRTPRPSTVEFLARLGDGDTVPVAGYPARHGWATLPTRELPQVQPALVRPYIDRQGRPATATAAGPTRRERDAHR